MPSVIRLPGKGAIRHRVYGLYPERRPLEGPRREDPEREAGCGGHLCDLHRLCLRRDECGQFNQSGQPSNDRDHGRGTPLLHGGRDAAGLSRRLCVGEGEVTLAEFLRAVEKKEDLSRVLGLAYLDEKGGFVYTGDRPFIENLDTLPLPAYHLAKMDHPFVELPSEGKAGLVVNFSGVPLGLHVLLGIGLLLKRPGGEGARN